MKHFEAAEHPLCQEIHKACYEAYNNAKSKGWHENDSQPCRKGEMIALIHSELSEALEAIRKGNPPDKKLPEFDNLTIEMADVVIRVFDFAAAFSLRLGQAVVAKMAYNTTVDNQGKSF